MLSQETQPHTLSQDTLLQDTRLLDTGMLSQDAYSHMLSQDTQSQDTDMLSQDTLSLASFPGPTPFWRGIGPGKVSAVCVFMSFTCFNIVIWLAAHFFVRPNVNTQTALTLPGPIPLQKGVGPGNEATLSQDTDMLSQDTLSQDTIK